MSKQQDNEIMDIFKTFKESQATFENKIEAWKLLYRSLCNEFEESEEFNLLPFGSTVTGFSLNNGDLDIVMQLKSKGFVNQGKIYCSLTRIWMYDMLKRCLDKLRDHPSFTDFTLIDATVPILKFYGRRVVEGGGGKRLKIELSCCEIGAFVDGTRNSHLLMCYGECDWRVKPLAVVVKKWAEHHSLIGNYHKRLSGYALSMMLIFYLQSRQVLPCLQDLHPSDFSPVGKVTEHLNYVYKGRHESIVSGFKSRNESTLSELLSGFFRFYSEFRYGRVISIRKARTLDQDDCAEYSVKRDGDARQWYKEVLVEDPFTRVNVTRATSNRQTWHRILQQFIDAHKAMEEGKSVRENLFFWKK